MPRRGTLAICVHNLDFSGANQVVLNIVSGRMHDSNVVVLSPKMGTFAGRFVESGASVRIGNLSDLLEQTRDVFCVICNTIMTADLVVDMSLRPHPVIWILHEWWDDEMIKENLSIRNYDGLTLATVKMALARAAMVVCVCEAQRLLYQPTAPSTVVFVGVPDPLRRIVRNPSTDRIFTILCLGIVCPRKNQLWTVQLFKNFSANKANVRLRIVGARYTRVYEIEYLRRVREEIGDDSRIELLDVTDNVDGLYADADCLMLTSVNEVTPMVISEAMSWGIPVISTNIAGIKEMFSNGVEGFHFEPGDEGSALNALDKMWSDSALRERMGLAARARFEAMFDLNIMVDTYRQIVMKVAPPVLLLDMDGALVDWDSGFYESWGNRCPVERTMSYFMEQCVNQRFRAEAVEVFLQQGFFEKLQPMVGALQAVQEMERDGLQVFICTSPVKQSRFCAQEKLNWIRKVLGEAWLDRVVLCQDKTMVTGDLLIDDKPYELLSPGGRHTTATWKQVLFDAPYNRQQRLPRLFKWEDWRSVVYPMLGRACPEHLFAISFDESIVLRDGCSMEGCSVSTAVTSDMLPVQCLFTSEEVQRKYDQLQPDGSLLNPEDIASITTGSVGLIDGESPPRQREVTNVQSVMEKSLQNKLKKLDDDHKKVKEDNEKEERDRAHSADADGVHVFRPSYHSWRRQGCTNGYRAEDSTRYRN